MKKSEHLNLAVEIYKQTDTITEAARKLCEALNIKYTDSQRRTLSKWINSLSEEEVTGTEEEISPAKILIFDIETAPLKSYIWGLWNQNLGHSLSMVESDWFMLTWSAKWLFEDKVFADKLTPEEVLKEDDSRVTKSIWDLFDKADVVVAHNALKFDVKRLNTRFLKNGFPPPMPYQVIDTLAHCRKKFNISSNKLDYIGEFLDLGGKIETGGFDLWKRCMEGDEGALQDMETYNIRDVRLLEDVYLALRPYIKPHPNMGLWISENVHSCPTCGSTEDLSWEGVYSTYANQYDAFRCGNCGSIGRSRTSKIKKSSKSNLTMSTPK